MYKRQILSNSADRLVLQDKERKFLTLIGWAIVAMGGLVLGLLVFSSSMPLWAIIGPAMIIGVGLWVVFHLGKAITTVSFARIEGYVHKERTGLFPNPLRARIDQLDDVHLQEIVSSEGGRVMELSLSVKPGSNLQRFQIAVFPMSQRAKSELVSKTVQEWLQAAR